MNNESIGIMGGTFDPIHYGHLILAQHVLDEMGLKKIMFIPSGISYLKSNNGTSNKKHRLNMTKIGIINNERFEVSTIEIDREGNTYTVDTIEELNEKHPNNTYYFIIGADSLFDLVKWKNYKRLFDTCNFVVTNRGSTYTNEQLQQEINRLKSKYDAKINLIRIPDIEISSSEIRRRVKNKQTIKYLLPEDVEKYIDYNKLYI
ncbi:nicotinate-nucleotide adenylyltransferase [Vallitalea sp.]|jgi:nicotinate-nucleotide adenylyltransferase|uniref:nicotinate-nucleotide adenylyltransferase n=1 Tax=Vallitalea sp. TaxID=1882829 RepID=UPI0025D51F3B|nr:nicotinate-nucleotide adenylyltransferase [Vallitalea sp.]MCT4688453.1 nicotinate-nucleotide adenylyltransferase [Vallitalea sp.]